ncbi:DUF6582 domain-containing protein [Oxalobacter paraformigenes]|uniref:Uncharacterized protein n=1 Tax=Oxalobacter paraformigenes TaxID=556268 RepID=C3X204_9BURK|nr:DUF6582 domain-containing protein [Oxalobacter paraformigenes]EEO27240.1 hypothetical protein OFAG_00393 [Oxalobacter paraformigenes]
MTKTPPRNPASHYAGNDRLTTEGRGELTDSEFGIPEKRAFPMPDAKHVRAAESRFHLAADDGTPELARQILMKANEFGLDVKSTNVLEWARK